MREAAPEVPQHDAVCKPYRSPDTLKRNQILGRSGFISPKYALSSIGIRTVIKRDGKMPYFGVCYQTAYNINRRIDSPCIAWRGIFQESISYVYERK